MLAYVLAHEITHIIEGVKRHSDSGIMKAHWDAHDYQQMRSFPLPFADVDLQMIHAWLHDHRRTLMAGMRK